MEFKPSFVKIEKGLIGEIIWNRMQLIKNTIQKCVFETISIGVDSDEIKILSNGHFISSNSSSVTLFDESFKQLKKVDIKCPAFGCAIYNDKYIYITDFDKHCIYLMDNELNIIKTFGSEGDGMDQFRYPCTICCQNEYLFVSDYNNKRIQILTLDFNYVDTIQLDFHPKSIALSRTTIGIYCYKNGIYFYDLKTKILKKRYQNIPGRISLIDSHFFVVTKKLLIFDEEGELIDEASVESISEHFRSYDDGFMFFTKDNLYVTSLSEGNVLKFKL